MIIGIDAGSIGVWDNRLKVGVYRVAKELLLSLSRIDKKNFYNLYSFFPIEKKLLSSLGSRFKNIVVKPQKGWFNLWLPLALQKNPVDVFIGLSQSLPRLPKKTKSIVFVYDLTFEKYPQWFKKTFKRMSKNSRNAVLNADKIISVSGATKKDILDIYQINKEKIKVIYPGLDHRFRKIPKNGQKILDKYGISKQYFLFVGTYKQSKNIPNILRAFHLFQSENKNFSLVLAGSNYWLDPEIEKVIIQLNLRDRVKMAGFVSDNLLQALYSQAFAFVSPSYNEGFGLTYLEAADFQIPIIASTTGAVKELLGSGALYANPDNLREIAKMMKRVTDPEIRQKLICQAKENTSKFSWEKSARSLLALFNK